MPDPADFQGKLQSWPDRTGADRHDPARFALGIYKRFESFLECLGVGDRGAASDRAAAAMAFLGRDGPPPPELWTSFEAVLGDLGSGSEPEPLNVFDLMLAFGCGWARHVDPGVGWYGRWEVAVFALLGQVTASVEETSMLLGGQGPRFSLTKDERLELPGFFTLALLRGCSCGHHVRSCHGACGRECCFEDHDLTSWDPTACGLRPFVDQAVRGRAGRKILGGAFAESLTYRFLEPPGRMLVRPVEFKRCPGCGNLYEESLCPRGDGAPAADPSVVRVARSNWLIVPEHEGGLHREVTRRRCGNAGCGNLLPIRFLGTRELPVDPCPACGWEPEASVKGGKVTLWVRTRSA